MNDIKDFEIENGVLIKYTGDGGEVVVPGSVTKIGEAAFKGCKNVTSVLLPDTITAIGYSAFCMCSSLSKIVIPDGVKEISMNAFEGCSSLISVMLPDSLERISAFSFFNCKKLSYVTIPESVTFIGRSAFEYSFLTEVCIPKGVKDVAPYAFSTLRLEKIRIYGKPKIGEDAFRPRYNDTSGLKHQVYGIYTPEIEAPDDVVVLPYVLNYLAQDIRFYRALLKQEVVLREADTRYYVKLMMSRIKSLGAEILPDITQQALSLIEKYGLITVKNADTLLEFFKDNTECRAELLDYINKNISTEQREDFEQKKFDKDVEKAIKRNNILEDALNVFLQKTPAEIKKEWATTDLPDGLSIKKYKGQGTAIVIPSVIGKKPVKEIAENGMRATGTLSDGCKSVYNKKMYKNKAVIIMDGIASIGKNAFHGCVYMTDICIPASVNKIDDGAFGACYKLTIHAPMGSYAEKYAIENNIPFVAE